MNQLAYIMGSVIAMLLIVVGVEAYELKSLELDLEKVKNEKVIESINANSCKDELKNQNSIYEDLSSKFKANILELKKWKSAPPKIKYKVIYKKIGEVKSDECSDVKNVLNSVRSINFNEL